MELEEMQIALASTVIFLRSHPCPYHEHAMVIMILEERATLIHGPVCEIAPELIDGGCEYNTKRTELLERCYEALGTKDMSEFT